MQKKVTTINANTLIYIYAIKKPTQNMEKTIFYRSFKKVHGDTNFFRFISRIYVDAKLDLKSFSWVETESYCAYATGTEYPHLTIVKKQILFSFETFNSLFIFL